MEKLLTVIVPTYNMEMYLDKCLTSLIVGEPNCEMMRNLEVLVINDGSTDKSSEIAHGYENRFPDTFRVVDKENGNYGSCINVALPLATGKYVKILDADDWFDTEVFKEYLTWLKDKDVDAVFTDYCKIRNENESLIRMIDAEPYRELSFDDCLSKITYLSMHGVTYNLGVFKDLGYHQTEGISYTDAEWVFLPMSVVKTIVYYPKGLYCYLLGRSGQTMDPVVRNKNFPMRIEIMFSCIRIYEDCCKAGGLCNGMSVNMLFLRSICLTRTVNLYSLMMTSHNTALVKYLDCVEKRMLKEYPEYYEKLNSAKYPCWNVPHFHLSFCVIRTWRKYGKMAVLVQFWLANHYLGLLSRLNRYNRNRNVTMFILS